MERNKIILAVLVGVFVISVIYRYRHPFEQPRVSRLRYAPGVKADGADKQTSRIKSRGGDMKYPKLANMDLFLHPPRHSGAVIRNPFYAKTTREKKSAAMPNPSPAKVPVTARQEEDPVQKAMRELSKFRVFGSFRGDGKTILFIERGRDILVVRKGDWIDGRFQLKDITPESITIWARDIGQDINIALDE